MRGRNSYCFTLDVNKLEFLTGPRIIELTQANLNLIKTKIIVVKIEKNSRYLLAYCTLARLLSSIVISGLLFSLDFISKTPFGIFLL